MQTSRGRRRLNKRSKTVDREEVTRLVKEEVKAHINHMGAITQLDKVIVKSFVTDLWGDIPMYLVEGYTEVRVKIGFLSTRIGSKGFIATVKAETGEILAINWEPGQVS